MLLLILFIEYFQLFNYQKSCFLTAINGCSTPKKPFAVTGNMGVLLGFCAGGVKIRLTSLGLLRAIRKFSGRVIVDQ